MPIFIICKVIIIDSTQQIWMDSPKSPEIWQIALHYWVLMEGHLGGKKFTFWIHKLWLKFSLQKDFFIMWLVKCLFSAILLKCHSNDRTLSAESSYSDRIYQPWVLSFEEYISWKINQTSANWQKPGLCEHYPQGGKFEQVSKSLGTRKEIANKL